MSKRTKRRTDIHNVHTSKIQQHLKERNQNLSSTTAVSLLICCLAICLFYYSYPNSFNEDIHATKTQAFVQWFQENGGKSPRIRIEEFKGMGNGIQATKAVKENDMLLTIPKSIIICKETIFSNLTSEESTFFQQVIQQEPSDHPALLLSFFLLIEKAKGIHSYWFPYLEILPQRINRPIFFNEGELQAIGDSYTIDAIRASQERLKKKYRLWSSHLKEVAANSSTISLSSYLWADSIVASRALSIQGERFLAPYADMFNGKPHEQARTHDNGNHFLKYHLLKSNRLIVRADRFCRSGDQIFEDYGDNGNDVYFHYHGFIQHNNEFDCVQVQLPSIKAEGNVPFDLVEKKQHILQLFHLSDAPTGCFGRDLRTNDRKMNTYLMIYLLNEEESDTCLASIASCVSTLQHLLDPILISSIVASSVPNVTHDLILSETLRENVTGDDVNEDDRHDRMRLALDYRLNRQQILHHIHSSYREPEYRGTRREEEEPCQNSDETLDDESHDDDDDEMARIHRLIERFNHWIERAEFPINKLSVARASHGMRLGTFAKERIEKGDVYLCVPPNVLMNEASAIACPVIGPFIQLIRQKFNGKSDPRHEFVFHLMYEKFVRRTSSYWDPYLAILPQVEDMSMPLFYTSRELQLLRSSDLHILVRAHRQKIRRTYDVVMKNVIQDHQSSVFDNQEFTFDNYAWAMATIDSRSIWWNGRRNLVPVLDLINCQEGPDPDQIHKTEWINDTALTRAPWTVERGDQVWENYGQPNYIYLLYHGFVLEQNTHDCALVHLELSVDDMPSDEQRVLFQSLQTVQVWTLAADFCIHPLPKTGNDKLIRFLQFLSILQEFSFTFDPKLEIMTRVGVDEREKRKDRETLGNVFRQLVHARLERLQEALKSSDEENAPSNFKEQMIQLYHQQQRRMFQQLMHQRIDFEDGVIIV